MKNKATRNNMRGFSLMEMLVTVLILVILFALAMIPISKIQKNLRQTELDSRAEMIFSAVQNRMTRLQAAGQSDVYQIGKAGVHERNYKGATLAYVTSDDKKTPNSAASWIYPETEAEAELWNANWVVEYDPSSGSVYAVFFSREKTMSYTPENFDDFDDLRDRDKRLEDGAKIGYYGGDSVGAVATESLDLTVDVINKDQLLVVASCKVSPGNKPQFYAVIKDESGHTAEFDIKKIKNGTNTGDTVEKKDDLYTATLVLDNLSTGKNLRFGQQTRFKDAKTGEPLIPGEDLTVTIRVKDEKNNQIQGTSKTVTTNSLFAEVRDDAGGTGRTAVIKYGRHLQNLEENSGLNRKTDRKMPVITAAVQERDIQFKSDESDSWGELYPTQNFVPLVNPKINSYCSGIGSYCPVIYDLTVNTTGDTNGDAGLFQTFSGELKNIRLANARIIGDGNVGGLVGKLDGETTIDGCQVYLKNVKDENVPGDEIFTKHTRIDGAVSGGLVGDTDFSALTIQNSLAATVIQGKTAAGGLVGNGRMGLTIDRSYADCYLYSDEETGYTGGLLGSWQVGTADISITNCYTAGFLKSKTTAGFVAYDLSADNVTLTNLYSACVPLTAEKLTYGTVVLNSSSGGKNAKNVYYLGESAESTIGKPKNYSELNAPNAVADLLSNAFTRKNSDTYAYNLMSGLGLTLYSYPKLKNLPHYGDWQAEFEEGALVYYEQYDGNSYGFFGANVEALSDKPVTGDGYGVVYENNSPTDPVIVTVNDQPYELKSTITVTDKDGTKKTYCLLPLPAKLVQEVDGVPQVDGQPSFYTKLMVGGAAGKAYYYNPHFAKTALTANAGAPESVSIRTARQLNNLSAYYDEYRNILLDKAAFQQERDINYDTYNWKDYGKDEKAVTQQAPIGQTKDTPFKHRYDGGSHIITGVSFASGENGLAVGLFGFTKGTLENIVVTTDQELANAPTSKLGGDVQRKTVYTGVLAGKNSGTIKNCAVSGYRLSGSAYSGSTYYLGGLVGCNEGLIQACSADIPSITGTSTFAQSYCAGGLVGMNTGSGQIRQSYALGSIKLTEIRGSAVISGFAGENRGVIRNCYCATALTAVTGAAVNGFSTDLGSVTKCYYLSGSTHTFAGEVRLYDYKPGTNGALARDHKKMKDLASELDGFAKVDEAHSLKHQNTDGAETVYPYPSSVTAGTAKTPVHYGDWVTDADMGTIGMVYWEKEEGGANSGYHFSYIGFDAKGFRKEGGSLCTAHDDGGKITDFGYGYYQKKDTGEVTLKKASMENGTFQLGDVKKDVAEALAKQVTGYNFTCYQTDVSGLRLQSSDTANGTWLLKQGSNTYTYAVCPFFGDSYCPVGDVDGNAQNLGKTTTTTTTKKPYQIRSVEQLQFINWSYSGSTGSVDRKVTESTYKTFPYLQYTTTDKNQSRADAEWNRPQRSWTQTHDVNGVDMEDPTNGEKNTPFHPIAGAVGENTSSTSYNVTLYTWFGGQYDGGNYYIKNINIDSYCYNVGVFGTTAGATIKNIVLYSDNGGIIQRSSNVTDNNAETKESRYQCAYALGGLAGIAYEYADERETSRAVIQNCAIAGYQIQDNSRNKLGLGEAVVGGLVGVSSLELDQCSAVADIAINCTHLNNSGNLNAAKFGNFIRVGGLVGGVRGKVSNCYTGGSITVSEDTLKERVKKGTTNDFVGLDTTYTGEVRQGSDEPATFVYIGGIGGSGFSSTFKNFGASQDGNPNFENCYTYMTFPKMQGTITAISLIGSVADRYGQNVSLTITNCYYFENSAKIDFTQLPKYRGGGQYVSYNLRWYHTNYESLYNLLKTEAAQEKMLQGNLSYLQAHVWDVAKATYNIKGLTPLTYEQMSDRIGGEGFIKAQNGSAAEYTTFRLALNKNKEDGAFDWVTTEENGSSIHGKYSFPGSDAALQGQDYPFPTVLRGTDSTGAKEVNLHYGAWPKVGMLWNEGIVSLDLIADYVPSSGAVKELKLNLSNVPDTLTGELKFAYSDEGSENQVVEVAASNELRTADGKLVGFDVTLEGLNPGAAEVTAKYGDYTARLMVTVTADLKVKLDTESVELNVGNTDTIPLTAVDKKGNPCTAVWKVTSDDPAVAEVTEPAGGQITVTGVATGETELRIKATCKVGVKDYTATAILPVSVKETSGGG